MLALNGDSEDSIGLLSRSKDVFLLCWMVPVTWLRRFHCGRLDRSMKFPRTRTRTT